MQHHQPQHQQQPQYQQQQPQPQQQQQQPAQPRAVSAASQAAAAKVAAATGKRSGIIDAPASMTTNSATYHGFRAQQQQAPPIGFRWNPQEPKAFVSTRSSSGYKPVPRMYKNNTIAQEFFDHGTSRFISSNGVSHSNKFYSSGAQQPGVKFRAFRPSNTTDAGYAYRCY
jgi:hypothetical protein